jgi:digeranylgeranylglycerophospholipid reductase
MPSVYDVVVVGSGPAGATTARYAAQGGLRVLLIDKKNELGTPVECSGAISANALKECDVPIDPEFIATSVYGFLTHSNAGEQIRLDYRQFGRQEPLGHVVDRKRFDRYLSRLAITRGADLFLQTRAVNLAREVGHAVLEIERFGRRELVTAKVVVGADGIMSQVSLMAGLAVPVPLSQLVSCMQYFVENVETEGLLEIVTGHDVAPGGYAWVFPKENGLAEVGLGVVKTMTDQDARWHLDRFMRESFMRERFTRAQIVELQGGGVPVVAPLKQMVADNVVIIGDAAHHINSITGGGIHTALRGGRMLGEFLAKTIPSATEWTREVLQAFQTHWFAELGNSLTELYRIKNDIFKIQNLVEQDRALFETLGNYFTPNSRFRKV